MFKKVYITFCCSGDIILGVYSTWAGAEELATRKETIETWGEHTDIFVKSFILDKELDSGE